MKNYLEGWKERQEVVIPPVVRQKFAEKIVVRKYIPPLEKNLMQEEEQPTVLLEQPLFEGDTATRLLDRTLCAYAFVKRLKTGEVVSLDKVPFVIGKGSDSDYIVKGNDTISRRHARIEKEKEEYFLTDLESANHSFIDGQKITEQVKLVNGMKFRLSDEEFQFLVEIR